MRVIQAAIFSEQRADDCLALCALTFVIPNAVDILDALAEDVEVPGADVGWSLKGKQETRYGIECVAHQNLGSRLPGPFARRQHQIYICPVHQF